MIQVQAIIEDFVRLEPGNGLKKLRHMLKERTSFASKLLLKARTGIVAKIF